MSDMFVEGTQVPDTDEERTCGCCEERKPVSAFYRDGKDNNGKVRYRRDCKDCYRVTRLRSRRAKRTPPPPPPRKRRK